MIEKDNTASESIHSIEFVLNGLMEMLRMWKSLITTDRLEREMDMPNNLIAPMHPGEVLFHEFLEPFNLSQNQLAQDIGVSPRRINEIIHGKRSITADTALRLARYFQMSPQFWMGLQMDYELDLEKDRLTDILARDVKIRPMKKCA